MIDDVSNQKLFDLGYRTETRPEGCALIKDGIVLCLTAIEGNALSVARRHHRASLISEPAIREAMRGLRK